MSEITAKIKGRTLVVSVSGGKDSTATALYLTRRLGLDVELVHMDTGWEHPDTARYLSELPGYLGQPIEVIRNLPELDERRTVIARELESRFLDSVASPYVRWILRKGMFSSRGKGSGGRWCTSYLKVLPFQSWALDRYGRADSGIGRFINVTGVRAEESANRRSLPEWGMDDKSYVVWRPLIDWTEADVIDIHQDYGIPPNPLYTRGAARVGCWPCIMCRKAELRQVAETDPRRIELIGELEAIVTELAKERAEAKGEPFFHREDGSPKFRAFFQNPNYRKDAREMRKNAPTGLTTTETDEWVKVRIRQHAPVHEVVAWSRTNRKGEPEPFAPLPHESGCTRWGFCDTTWRNDAGVAPPQLDLLWDT